MTIDGTGITDAMIGLTTGTRPPPLSPTSFLQIPVYGAPTAPCKPSDTRYKSILKILAENYSTLPRPSGQLTVAGVTSILPQLDLCQIPSTLDKSSIEDCVAKNAIFIQNAQTEFKYYYVLYTYAIVRLMAALKAPDSAPLSGWTSNADAVFAYKTAAIQLNQNVNDVTFAIDVIAQNRRTANIPALTAQLSALDESLQGQAQKLYDQRQILSKDNQSNMILKKEMEAYSRQKANYHNNMLMLYSFLNITALGLLFYVYRSM